jgi:hypothetical protein
MIHRISLHTKQLSFAVGFAAVALASSAAATTPSIVRVEEDWELVVASPDSNSVGPQVTCMISATGDFTSLVGGFDVNHRSWPGFVGGGLQLQVCEGELPLETKESVCDCTMSQSDTVRWTASMALQGDNFVLEISDGTSATWGSFGNQGNLKTITATTLGNLNAYTPNFSVQNSGVGYAANRVQSLVLKRVRLITDTGQVIEDSTPRTVHSQN